MNTVKRNISGLLAVTALGLVLSPSSSIAQQGSLRQQLVGTWILASCDAKTLYCQNGSGSLAYSGSGRFTLLLQAKGRPKMSATGPVDRAAVSPEIYKAIGQGVGAQFGTFSVNEADKTVTHHTESAFNPANEGTDAKFTVSLTGDNLKVVTSAGTTFNWKKSTAPQTLRQQLVGTWNLVSCENKNLSICSNPNGSVSVGADGRYTEVLTDKGRAKVASLTASSGRANVTPEDYKSIAQGVIANFGTWNLNEADKTVTIHSDGALFPNAEGTDRKVTIVSVTGDELKVSGGPVVAATWRRAK